ncbi:MAG: hypothetical protein M1834_007234 [Cirrosporium novae-zelandiae]|nr:MAG: hypothetical protein M1834_007234 [Cirrosporium novae-zelandiae]
MPIKPTLVMIHGAWHNRQCFETTSTKLQSLGYETITPDLPSSSVTDEGKDVGVILHSYSGVPGCEALHGLAKAQRDKEGYYGGVIFLLFMTAWVVEEGKSISQYGKAKNRPPVVSSYSGIPGSPIDSVSTFYNDLSPSEADMWASRLKHQNLLVFRAPLTYPAYQDIPSTFLLCENDQAITKSEQEECRKILGDSARIEMCTAGHFPFISQSDRAVEVIRRAVGEQI